MSEEMNNETNDALANSDVDESGEDGSDAVEVALAEIEAARAEMPEDVDAAVARVLVRLDVGAGRLKRATGDAASLEAGGRVVRVHVL